MLAEGTSAENRVFVEWVHATFPIALREDEIRVVKHDVEPAVALVFERIKHAYELKLQLENPATIDMLERHVMLHCIDTYWQDYLRSMDNLRQGVGLRAYGQRDPLVEYKREAFEMFASLMTDIRQDIAVRIFRSSTTLMSAARYVVPAQQRLVHDQVAILGRAGAPTPGAAGERTEGGSRAEAAVAEAMRAATGPIHRDKPKVGRNEPCPCGSGKKYKKCCGANA
jgi:preprotein translocase subunit SecA